MSSTGLLRLACCSAIVAALSATGFAQSRYSIAAPLDAFLNASSGAFGDEGPRLTAALDAMDVQVAAWDAAVQRVEHGLATDIGGASPKAAAQMRATLGAVYMQRGRLADAARQLRMAADLETSDTRTALLLGAALAGSGHARDAHDAWQRASDGNPHDPAAAYLAAHTAANGAAAPAAVDALVDAATRSDPDAPLTLPLSTALDDAAVSDPVFAPARYGAAVRPLLNGDYGAAVAALRAAAAADPLVTDPATRAKPAASAIAALRTGAIPAALQQLRAAAAAAPDSSEVHRALAMALWADQQTEAARVQFDAALRLRPDDERAYVALADMLVEHGDDAGAKTVLERAVAAIPASGQAHWRLGQLDDRLHRDADALTQYEACASTPPLLGAGRVYAEIGRLQQARVDFDAAARAYGRWIALQPNVPGAHRALADVDAAKDRSVDALVERLAVALLDPHDAGAFAAAAQSLVTLDRFADAERAARRAISIDPDNKDARYALSIALEREGRHDESARELAIFTRLQQRWLEAERRTYAVNSLRLQAQVATDPAARAAAWQQIVDAETPTADNEQHLGEALAAAGRVDDAIAAYAMAVRLGAPPAADRALIALYDRAGRRDEADLARAAFERRKQDRIRRLAAQ